MLPDWSLGLHVTSPTKVIVSRPNHPPTPKHPRRGCGPAIEAITVVIDALKLRHSYRISFINAMNFMISDLIAQGILMKLMIKCNIYMPSIALTKIGNQILF